MAYFFGGFDSGTVEVNKVTKEFLARYTNNSEVSEDELILQDCKTLLNICQCYWTVVQRLGPTD